MDNKEIIIQAAIDLINEKGERMDDITVREICKKANVGLGLVNYHFENKDKLIELCVERIVNGIVENFHAIREKTEGFTPFEKLDYLGNMTLTFLFEHYAVSKTSILTDMRTPKEDDNTHRTYLAYLPLVSACRPGWDKETLERKTFCLITVMQQAFLRYKVIKQLYGFDLTDSEERRAFHSKILRDILEA
ncbi:MAG: TetR/AcrR family transcriptional regulator [Lachnospiraceae bacterium]|jgi:AcrR family transcriptional regulator|nr:TetR/AcrR family transcriptional regulator [Lachnospiraceae bacterium]